jgi:hypothetical protein
VQVAPPQWALLFPSTPLLANPPAAMDDWNVGLLSAWFSATSATLNVREKYESNSYFFLTQRIYSGIK